MKQKFLLTLALWLTLLGSAWAQTNNALYFDGTNDYVRIKAINPTNFTVEAWVCPTALGKDQAIISTLSTNSNTGMELHIASDNIPVLTIHGGIGFIDIKGTTAIAANTWTHIAATYNGYSASIYVNGVQTKSVLANTYQAGTQALYLGRRIMSGVLFFTGKIDEVRVWNSARTQAEIIETMTSNLTGNETGLLAFYSFNQGMANGNNSGVNTLYDATTNRNNGSLTYFSLSGTTSNWVEGYNTDSYTDTIYVYTDQIVLADTAGSSQAFSVYSNRSWTISKTGDWLDIDIASGTGNASIIATTNSSNTTTTDLKATLTISAPGHKDIAIIVTQYGKPEGSGTQADPYQIASLGKLYWLSQNSWAWSAYFIQTTDIDATCTKDWNSGLGFSPIGNSTITNFNGHYNGKGHTIKGLYINRSATVSVGLFGDCNKATIDSLCVTDAFIKGNKFVGSIVGRSNLSTLKCCRASNAVSGSWYIGGLVGYASGSSNVSNCYSTSDVSGANYVGGLVGSNNYYSQISNCYSTGNVSGTDYVGGLAGINDYSTKISNCYFTGSVKGNSCVGGMVGYNISTSNIENGYFAGTVSGKTNLVGATAGVNSANSTISNVYWNWQVSKTSDCGEDKGTTINITRLSTEQIKKPANLNNLGSFETVWAIREDSTYAVLQDISNNAPFAFNDNIGVTGRTSLLTVLNNDYDYETLQSKLAIKFTQLPNTGSITNKYYYSFPIGTPAGSQNSFQYRVGEVLAPGDTLWGNTATVVLTKVANTAPSALNDAAILTEDSGTTTIDALANDFDADKDLISISGIASGYPLHGMATISNGKIDYTPATDYNGTDTIAYIISDGDLTNTANVIVTITSVNDAPVLTAVSSKTINGSQSITLTMDDVTASDVDGDELELIIAPSENYTESYNLVTPAENFHGTLSVGVWVTDGELTSNQMVMEITVSTSTGIDDNTAATVSAYPNPCHDYVEIGEDAGKIRRVSFVNLAGQTMLVEEAPTGRIHVASLKPGIYLVKVEDNDGKTTVLRLVKQ